MKIHKVIGVLLLLIPLITSINNDYVVDDMHNFYRNGTQGIYASVHYTGSDEYYQKPTSPIVQKLNATITFDSNQELTIRIDDATQPRFRVPDEFPYPYTKPTSVNNPAYDVIVEEEPFNIIVKRIATGETVFDTSNFDFVYSDYYLSFGTKLPSKYLYGLGERRRSFMYDSGLYTIWNKDQYAQIDWGQGSQQTYGCHPMYMIREGSGLWDVVYLRNSNAMDFRVDSQAETLQFFLTGSLIELKFFFGYTYPEDVLKLYHNYINGWSLMPFWAHGYHQSKYGVLYLDDLLDVVGNFTNLQLPIDVIWSDIDYMYSFTDFTVDDERYNVAKFREMAEKIHWVPIMDAGVSLNETADSYTLGQKYNVWIKSANNNTNPLVGVAWPGVVHWVDWANDNATKYWTEMFNKLYKQVPFSGIWLDMNENSNFCFGEYNNSCNFLADYLPDGVYPDGNRKIPDGDQNPNLPPSNWSWFNSTSLPYVPGNTPLEDKSIAINALHSDGTLEFDVHNLVGLMESFATYKALQGLTGKRPFILSRSTTVGSGLFAAHWSGDNYATWDFLRLSIPCVFNFQLFGIPMSGDDICGFGGNTTEELCTRWMQLGSFYPFMRNHMSVGTIDHYPYSFGDTLLHASMASLKLRYSLLKYYYSLFIVNRGLGTVFKPLFFDFPSNTDIFNLESQFLIGSGLMVAAVVEEGKKQVSVYFPAGSNWYNFATGESVFSSQNSSATLTFDAPLEGTLPVFIRGGWIVPVQDVKNVTRTEDLDTTLHLVVALNAVGDYDHSFGEIMGIANYSNDASVDKCTDKNDCMIGISVTNVKQSDGTILINVYINPTQDYSILEKGILIGNITLYGVRTQTCDAEDNSCLNAVGPVVCNVGEPFEVIMPSLGQFVYDGVSCKDANSVLEDEVRETIIEEILVVREKSKTQIKSMMTIISS